MKTSTNAPLFSTQWYRVNQLRPTLSSNIEVNYQVNRGQAWYLISATGQSKRVRINESAYQVIGRCDGTETLETIFRTLLQCDANTVASQTEIIELIGKLVGDGYLHCQDWPQLGAALDEQQKQVKKRVRQRLNPIAPRLALINPNAMLAKLDPLSNILFSGRGFAIWLCVLIAGLIQTVTHTTELGEFASHWSSLPGIWLITALCFPIIKLFHEIAHGMAVRRWGGQVTEAGMALLLLFPAPYVDASDANQFSRPSQRAWVSAAGIAAELLVAAVAILVWSLLDDGLLRNVLFSCAVIASVSTVAFNANPLVRLDGYYVLSDAAGLPNLSQRSQQLWRWIFSHYLLRIPIASVEFARGERAWLFLYQPLSWFYRLSIFFWFAWWISTYSMLMAVLIGAAAAIWLIVIPIGKLAAIPYQAGLALTESTPAWTRLGGLCAIACILIFIPIPDRTIAQGIVWTPENSIVRARHDGFIVEQPNPDNQFVHAEQIVLTLVDPTVDSKLESIQRRLPGLKSAWIDNLSKDPVKARRSQEKLRQTSNELTYIADASSRLNVVSPARGQLRIEGIWSDMIGRFVREGDALAHIESGQPSTIRLVLNQNQAARVRVAASEQGSVSANIRFITALHTSRPARLLQMSPGPATKLPSAALADVNGGPIAIDTNEPATLKPLHPTYLLDVVAQSDVNARIGSRAYVLLDFGHTSAVNQVSRWIRQLLNTSTTSQLT